MDLYTKLKYIIIYIILNSIGIYLAFQNWWEKASPSPGPIFFLLFCAGICWLGIIFLSIMISTSINPNQNKNTFISILSLATKEDYENVFGKTEAKKMKRTIQLLSFGMLISTIFIFIISMNFYKNYQLEKYGITENVRVSKILFDVKKNEYSFVKYGNEKYSTTLLTKLKYKTKSTTPKENDSIKIIYSLENPKIVELYSNYIKEE